MRSDRYLKKHHKRKGPIATQAIPLTSPGKVKAIMSNIAKISWATSPKDFIK